MTGIHKQSTSFKAGPNCFVLQLHEHISSMMIAQCDEDSIQEEKLKNIPQNAIIGIKTVNRPKTKYYPRDSESD